MLKVKGKVEIVPGLPTRVQVAAINDIMRNFELAGKRLAQSDLLILLMND